MVVAVAVMVDNMPAVAVVQMIHLSYFSVVPVNVSVIAEKIYLPVSSSLR